MRMKRTWRFLRLVSFTTYSFLGSKLWLLEGTKSNNGLGFYMTIWPPHLSWSTLQRLALVLEWLPFRKSRDFHAANSYTIFERISLEQKQSFIYVHVPYLKHISYWFSYEQRTKPITSAKGRGWNGHRFLCVPHRSWGFNRCNKIRQTCVSKVIVFCVTPIVPESFVIVSSINVLVWLFQIVGGFGGRSYMVSALLWVEAWYYTGNFTTL